MTHHLYHAPLIALSDLDLDSFETNLLPIARDLLSALQDPPTQDWQTAYRTAAEIWGPAIGLSVAHELMEVLSAVLSAREVPLCLAGKDDDQALNTLTSDEAMVLLMIRYLRRDNPQQARNMVENLTHGIRDAQVMKAGSRFGQRFAASRSRDPFPSSTVRPEMSPSLKIVG